MTGILPYFTVNTPAAEVLYSTVAGWCQVGPQTVLLDICCGTGTIGLTMAKVGIHVAYNGRHAIT